MLGNSVVEESLRLLKPPLIYGCCVGVFWKPTLCRCFLELQMEFTEEFVFFFPCETIIMCNMAYIAAKMNYI